MSEFSVAGKIVAKRPTRARAPRSKGATQSAACASPRSSRDGYFASSRVEKQGGWMWAGPVATAWPMTLRDSTWAGPDCGVLSNESSSTAPCPHVGSEFRTATAGCRPITPGKDINLDADWLAVFHRVPSLVTFRPMLLTLLLPHRKGAALLIKHNPAM